MREALYARIGHEYAGGRMSSPKNSGSNVPATRAWLVLGVVASLVAGVVLGYFLKSEDDTS